MDELASGLDTSSPRDLWRLVQEAQRRTLRGTARQWARKLIEVDPDHRQARGVIGHTSFRPRGASEAGWFDAFELEKRRQKMFRHVDYGWFPEQDRERVEAGELPVGGNRYVSIVEMNAQHATWDSPWEIDSRFYRIKSTESLQVLWFVADDLDAFTLSYLDHFEIQDLPCSRYPCHLYRTVE
ncbi:MAG: hypothetical protein HY608_06910, partial [Planctomycetes bacterium]|nr:hypothetical protein [Planctomycetota bacterium]